MDNLGIITLIGATVLSSALLLLKKKEKIKDVFFLSIGIVFLTAFYKAFFLYQGWQGSLFTRSFLPPITPISYFVFYSFFQFFLPYILALLAALIFLGMSKKVNKRFDERFFEEEEIWLGSVCLFLSNYPGWLIYGAVLLILYLVVHVGFYLKNDFLKKEEITVRLPLYYFWIPTALITLVLNKFVLSNFSWWLKLLV